MMRRWPIWLISAIVLLVLAYVSWPLFGLKKIADAVEARDGARLVQLLDVPELKRSIAVQLVRTYLQVSGKERLSPLATNLAIQAGIAVADAYVIDIVKAESLIELLTRARAPAFNGPGAARQGWGLPNLRSAGRFLASEYRGRNFYISLPLSAAPKDGFRLRLRLSQWRWKLAGLDLPEPVRLRLVEEFRARGGIP